MLLGEVKLLGGGKCCSGEANVARGRQMLLGGGKCCSGEKLPMFSVVLVLVLSCTLKKYSTKIKIFYSHLFPLFFSNSYIYLK